jgi:hypothetical protein
MEYQRGKKRRWIGHALRQNGFVTNIVEGKIEGKVSIGRPRDKYMGQLKKKVPCKKHQEVSTLTLGRVEWRTAVS